MNPGEGNAVRANQDSTEDDIRFYNAEHAIEAEANMRNNLANGEQPNVVINFILFHIYLHTENSPPHLQKVA
jgi:hypothetical protein